MPRAVFLTGASGFMGRRLGAELVRRGYRVRGLVRRGSEGRVAGGVDVVVENPARGVRIVEVPEIPLFGDRRDVSPLRK
jgi:nucleoside-diphosphate-sugar epimerase